MCTESGAGRRKLKAQKERGRSIYKRWWLCLGPPTSPLLGLCVSQLLSLVFHPWSGEQAMIETSQTCWSFQSEWCPWVSLSFRHLLKAEQDIFAFAKITVWSWCGICEWRLMYLLWNQEIIWILSRCRLLPFRWASWSVRGLRLSPSGSSWTSVCCRHGAMRVR